VAIAKKKEEQKEERNIQFYFCKKNKKIEFFPFYSSFMQ
jgi:hypothetical protein